MRRRRHHRVDLTVADVGDLLALAASAPQPDPEDSDVTPRVIALWHLARDAVAADRPTLVSVWH